MIERLFMFEFLCGLAFVIGVVLGVILARTGRKR